MKVGERAIVEVRDPEFGFSDLKRPSNVPANAQLQFDVKVLRFDKDKNSWELSEAEKYQLALKKRETGNRLYGERKYKTAIRAYDQATALVKTIKGDKKRQMDDGELNAQLATCLFNSAAYVLDHKL